MHTFLDKKSLFTLLEQRFAEGEKKLAQIPNPALLNDASKAAQKIAHAIQTNKHITLVGDYDVDGVSSTAIMVDFFRQIPYPLHAIIPNRFKHGYGVSPKLLETIETDLIITVDNGISAKEAAEICKERGIELIITDHHTPSDELPHAYAIVDPKLMACEYPFKEICGAQVAWLLLALVKKELNLSIDMKQFLDILAIAIIADIMPLIDINRTLVKEGLNLIMRSQRPASIIIRDFLNKSTITSEDIGFMIAPRLNSAGRLEDAKIALDFFLSQNTHEAYLGFERLSALNDERKQTEAEATKEAIAQVRELGHGNVIVVANYGWHEGVVGIVASRLVDTFGKPAIVLSINDGIAKGSARSIGEINIYELIKANEHLLTKFGGHMMAAGLGLLAHNIEEFRDAINQSASTIDPKDFVPKDKVLGIIQSDMIDFELLDILERFEPYGEANPRPSFLIKDAEIVSIALMGKEKSHSRISVRQAPHERQTLELILFHQALEMPQDRKITCSYTVSKNEFNSKVSVQLLVNKVY
ncbi:MAG: single-stranded-DNA-specific exonuclease RecJ [Sulfurimonadaceae bacterium]|nr:single-stranded-DNA-specific exonuclease RecJ [Sulfurimonadaceae bacterium]